MRVDIKLPEEIGKLMNDEKEVSGMAKRTIGLIAVTEYLKKMKKEREKK